MSFTAETTNPPPMIRRVATIGHCEDGINQEARKQAFRAPHHLKDNFIVPDGTIWSERPLAISTCPPGLRHFIGVKRGRVQVIGFYHSHRSGCKTRHTFVSKCACGAYQVITNVSLSKPDTGKHACARCSYHEHVSWAYSNHPDWKGRALPA